MSAALITGASKGIGKAIARELAARKNDLLLVARSGDLLEELAADLSSSYNIQVRCLSIDLSATDAVEQVINWVKAQGWNLQIIVNNAGYGLSGRFEQYRWQQQREMMQVNMWVPVGIIHGLLPDLLLEKRAYILNIASTAAYQAVPGLSLYAATKAFILRFSRGLRYELRNTGITVTAVSPGATDTEFPQRAQVGEKANKAAAKLNMQPEVVAKQAVEAMYAGKAEHITGLINKLACFFVWLLPDIIAEKAAAGIYEL